jgi:lactate dehydrogenase-like 2-hydroxyacid dehydrogenase
MPETILQLASTTPKIQAILEDRYVVLQEPKAEHLDAWLAAHAASVRGVVTAGGRGIETDLARRLPNLGIVAINGVGFDRVDTVAMKEMGVRVTNTPDVLTDDVADVAIALMINTMRGLVEADRHVREGRWVRENQALKRTASGRRYGIVGLGRIGHAIAQRLAGFGGTIAYTSQSRKDVAFAFHADARALAASVDVLFVATAASAATKHLIDRAVLDALGPDGVLVNIARGSVVDEEALVAALVEHRLGGAGLDVFANEPHVPPALFDLPHVVLAPHVGSATHETRHAMGSLMVENLDAYFAGRKLPTAVV